MLDPVPDPLWVYIDETSYEGPDGVKWCGAGAMVVERPVPQAAIDSALAALEQDPDRHDEQTRSRDDETLKRRYFHATDDSKNAHSHLTVAINENVVGRFCYSFGKPDERGDWAAFRKHMMASLMSLIRHSGPLNVVFEQRSNFGNAAATKAIEFMHAALDWSSYALPEVRTFYPPIHVQVKSKEDPGLQFVDFMLWACVQKRRPSKSGKSRWYDRLHKKSWTEEKNPNLGTLFGSFETTLHEEHLDGYPDDAVATEPLNNSEYADLYCTLERVLHRVILHGLPPHAEHLVPLVDRAWSRMRSAGESATLEHLQDLARAYLRLFDTVPLYDEAAGLGHLGFRTLYRTKLLCLILVRFEQTASVSLGDHLLDVREGILSRRPDLLDWKDPPA